MQLTNAGPVPVYTISGPSTARQLPDWLARRRKRSLKNDPEWSHRVELLQDFEMPEASTKVAVSEDGMWVMSTGTYKPQMRVHDLSQLSLSFARHTTTLCHTFILLSSDYSKSLHLGTERNLELHTPSGCHYELRLPRYGRDLLYDRRSTEALVPATAGHDTEGNFAGEVFRLNLELGRFMKSYQVDVGADEGLETGLQGSSEVPCVNVGAIAESTHNLLSFGTSKGTVEFWDSRSRSRVALLDQHSTGEVTSLDFNPSGLSIATGSSSGIIQLYDLRRPIPYLTKDHGYGFPIKVLKHVTTSSQEKKLLASDKRIIKLYDTVSGDLFTSVEPAVDINDVAWVPDTGMLLTANEGPAQHAFHIPQLGPAPRWCSFLDNLVEEMAEEVHTETYANYKFVTIPELRSLSLAHLVGKTNLLRPYMHGFFVASKLYDQARLIANPYVWEEERAKRIKEKVEKERASRIRGTKKVKVNQKLVDRILKRQEKRDKVDTNAGILGDDRFQKLFEDEEFAVDETSREFKALNPSTVATSQVEQSQTQGLRQPKQRRDSDDDSSSASDEDLPIRTEDDIRLRVSSSAASNGKNQTRDTALGTRKQKPGRVRQVRPGDVAGEKQIIFVPEDKNKQKRQDTGPRTKRSEPRRSASTNTFRRM